MNEIRLTKYIRSMYDVSKVNNGYDYWFFKILNILLDIFEYNNIPSGTTSRDIELNLLLTGHVVFVPESNGDIWCPLTVTFGQDRYYQPTHCTWANPVINNSKTWVLHEDCEIVYNSTMKDYVFYIKADNSMLSFIGKYARLLSDIESTIDIYIVNQRLTCIPTTDDSNVAQSIKAFFKKLTLGERAIITDSNIVQQFRNIDINKSNIGDKINDWLIARDKIIEMMFRDLGVRMYNPKKAQVNENEIESNNQMLLISLDDMMKARIEGLEKVNDMFGTSIEVGLNPRFNVENFTDVSRETSMEVIENE